MGWYFSIGGSRKEVIAEVNEGWDGESAKHERLRHCLRGNVLWGVWEQTVKATGAVDRYITCHLLSRGQGDGWGYKPMDESVGPCYYTCPLSYLEMAPEVNAEWRRAVQRYWKVKKARKLGD
jgi:hypothetical protein